MLLATMLVAACQVPPGGKVDCTTDGTGVFVDDDGQGYIVFATSTLPNGLPGSPTHVGGGHVVSIEKLTPDLTSTTQEAVVRVEVSQCSQHHQSKGRGNGSLRRQTSIAWTRMR
eukprot:INCI16400.7.p3 GENE.INCI16400.7~~INCI16400.7.p3  ORF type:complete len:114 (+),score=17.92 INCI16400.7:1288-1629(+)